MEKMEVGLDMRVRAVMAEFEMDTNEDLGNACGAQSGTVNNWLRGDNGPRVPEMIRLCENTGLTLDWIYRGKSVCIDPELATRLENRIATGNIKQKVIRNRKRPVSRT